MSRIEIPLEEYQAMKSRIKSLESSLNSVSHDASVKKETLEQAKALFEDLKSETLYNRVFSWKKILTPLQKLLYEKVPKNKKTNKTK